MNNYGLLTIDFKWYSFKKMMGAIQDKSLEFAVLTGRFCFEIQNQKKEFIYTKQLIRSSSSIGANVREADFAVSIKDFIHKMAIALKEANESAYWLELLRKTDISENDYLEDLVVEIIKILTAIINTSKRKSG